VIGDHIKVGKEARYMPGVKKLHQDSENVGKEEYIFGHQFGMIGLLAEGPTTQRNCRRLGGDRKGKKDLHVPYKSGKTYADYLTLS